MQGEEALLALVRDEFGNLAHAETARVARKDGVRRSDPVEPLEQVLLRLEVLDDRFDDQVGRGGGFLGRSGRRDVGKDAVDVILLGGGVVGRLFARDASQRFVDDGASIVPRAKAEQSFFVSARFAWMKKHSGSGRFLDLPGTNFRSGESPRCPFGVLIVSESEKEPSPVVESLVADIRNDHLDTRICRNLFPSGNRPLSKSALGQHASTGQFVEKTRLRDACAHESGADDRDPLNLLHVGGRDVQTTRGCGKDGRTHSSVRSTQCRAEHCSLSVAACRDRGQLRSLIARSLDVARPPRVSRIPVRQERKKFGLFQIVLYCDQRNSTTYMEESTARCI